MKSRFGKSRQPSRNKQVVAEMRRLLTERNPVGGFARLRDDFGKWVNTLDPSHMPGEMFKNDSAKLEQAVFRFLYLRCLFEIAGNLDSIALCQRAIMEQLEKLRTQKKDPEGYT